MMKNLFTVIVAFLALQTQAQGPSGYDLIQCTSADGIIWTNKTLFQDSSGVPSIAQHSTGAIYCAFQWFPAPNLPGNLSFDKIAIKKSTDGGLSWGQPTLAVINGYPSTYKRPFDPTLVVADDGQIRMYFSGSKTGSLTLLDSTVHAYSAISPDGVNYTFEPGVRVAVDDSITIDPAVVKIGSVWHYLAPRGAPQHGAFHFTSNDGLAWTRTVTVPSDMNHNYTGNFMMDGATAKFYGTPFAQNGPIWFNTTTDGYTWTGFQNCIGATTTGGVNADPAVIKLGPNNYMMVYVSSLSVTVGMSENKTESNGFLLYPNPNHNSFSVQSKNGEEISSVSVYDLNNRLVLKASGNVSTIDHQLNTGLYFIEIKTDSFVTRKKIMIN